MPDTSELGIDAEIPQKVISAVIWWTSPEKNHEPGDQFLKLAQKKPKISLVSRLEKMLKQIKNL
jgi:predicted signal transduction protein with EAL and GGDEF domain